MHRKIFAVILAGVLSLLTLTACLPEDPSEVFWTPLPSHTMKGKSAEELLSSEAVNKFPLGWGAWQIVSWDEGEQITISSDLEKGSVRVEIFRWGEEQDADTLPETGGEATLTANLHAADGASGTVEPGNYSLKAVCLEKATGTVTVEVVPAE